MGRWKFKNNQVIESKCWNVKFGEEIFTPTVRYDLIYYKFPTISLIYKHLAVLKAHNSYHNKN